TGREGRQGARTNGKWNGVVRSHARHFLDEVLLDREVVAVRRDLEGGDLVVPLVPPRRCDPDFERREGADDLLARYGDSKEPLETAIPERNGRRLATTGPMVDYFADHSPAGDLREEAGRRVEGKG